MLGHKVKGPAIFIAELTLASTGINDGFYLTGKWQEKIDRVNARLASPFSSRDRLFLETYVPADSLCYEDSLRFYEGEYEYSRAIRDRTLAFTAGFHIYNLLDCYNYLAGPVSTSQARSPKGAFVRALLVPGWGQLYNRSYAKLGLVIMASCGLAANIYAWNRTAGYFEDQETGFARIVDNMSQRIAVEKDRSASCQRELTRLETTLMDQGLSATARDSLLDQQNVFRMQKSAADQKVGELTADAGFADARQETCSKDKKRYLSWRNQNIWYAVAVYFYAAFDALVDAHLSDFDARLGLTVYQRNDGLTAALLYTF